jgi:hypothetical protein
LFCEQEFAHRLGALGALLAWSTFGSPIVWAIGMMAGGIACRHRREAHIVS